MIAFDLVATRADEVARLLRALGAHRYVAGRMHLVHAFAFASMPDGVEGLENACAWARRALESQVIDIASRDERLWRRSSEREVATLLEVFWGLDDRAEASRAALRAWLDRAELPIADGTPFDESAEDDIHPLLVDVGWELLPLSELHPERHRGAIEAFGDPLYFEAAKFEEATAIPAPVYLQELSAIGPLELLAGVDTTGTLVSPLTLWAEGHETYHDYVVRGVLRAAKLTRPESAP